MSETATETVLELRPVDATIMAQGQFEYWETTDKGIAFTADTPEEVWLEATHKVAAMYAGSAELHCRAMFYLGDCLRFGEDKFGERFSQAIDTTRGMMKVNAKTIQNVAWICGKIAPELRHVDSLSLAHHEIVAKLPPEEQEQFLTQAEEEAWNTEELKSAVKIKHPGKTKLSTKPKPKPEGEEEPMSDSEAVESMERLILFFDTELEKEAFKNWPADRIAAFKPGLNELNRITRRCVANGKKKS